MSGAELVKKLKESHTPDHLLAPGRRILADDPLADGEDVVNAYRDTLGEDHGTHQKARRILETGTHLAEDQRPEEAIEERILKQQAARMPTAAKSLDETKKSLADLKAKTDADAKKTAAKLDEAVRKADEALKTAADARSKAEAVEKGNADPGIAAPLDPPKDDAPPAATPSPAAKKK